MRFFDIVLPARAFEGPLHRLERRHQSGKLGGFQVWQLASDDQTWTISCTDVPADFADKLKPGAPVQVKYRRGTGLVTTVSVSDDKKTQEPRTK